MYLSNIDNKIPEQININVPDTYIIIFGILIRPILYYPFLNSMYLIQLFNYTNKVPNITRGVRYHLLIITW